MNFNMDYKLINPGYLDSVSGGDAGIIRELVDIFREQVIEIYNEMNSQSSAKNYTELGMLAHKAKSSVAIMGMSELTEMLKTFELQAKAGKDIEKYESWIERFRNDTGEAVAELDDLIKTRLH